MLTLLRHRPLSWPQHATPLPLSYLSCCTSRPSQSHPPTPSTLSASSWRTPIALSGPSALSASLTPVTACDMARANGIGTASEGGQGEGEDGPRHKTLKHEGVSRFTKCCRRCAERCAWPDRRSAECGSRIPLPGSVDPQEGSSGGCNFTCIAISVKFLEISIHVLRFHEIP